MIRTGPTHMRGEMLPQKMTDGRPIMRAYAPSNLGGEATYSSADGPRRDGGRDFWPQTGLGRPPHGESPNRD